MTVQPFRLGFPVLPPPLREYNRENEANFRLSVEQLLKQLVSATNTVVDTGLLIEGTLRFVPNNTYDVGDITGPYLPRTVYAATSVIAPLVTATTLGGTLSTASQPNVTAMTGLTTIGTLVAGAVPVSLVTAGTSPAGTYTFPTLAASVRLTSALLGTTTNTNVVIDRNSVTQLTLASLLATFAGDVTVTGDNLNVNGLTYTWPSSQSANRVLRNTGPGTLAWSQVDLSTDVTGSMSGGTVPASQVTAGTFPGTTYAWSDAAMSLTYVAGTGLQGEFGFYGGGGLAIYDGGYLFYEGTGIAGGVAIIINGDNATAQPAIAWQTGGVQKFATFINSSNKLALGHGSFTTDLTLDSAGLFAFQNAVDFMAAIRVLGNVYTSRIDTATAGAGDLTLWRNGVSKLTLGNALANFADPISGPALYSTILDSNGASDLLLKYNAITVLTLNTTTATFSGSVTTTELFSPTVDSGSGVDLVLQRNNVTQLTLASSAATFVGSVQGTTLTGTTRVTAPLIGTTTGVDVVFDRNSVTQLTLGSLAATFAGTATATEFLAPSFDSGSNTDTLLQRNNVTRLTLGSSTSTFAGPLAITGALSGVTTLAISSDVTYSSSSWALVANTADAADTSRAFFAGGGAAATGRGAYVGVHGQEHATNPGELYLIAGNAGFIRTFGTVRADTAVTNDIGTTAVPYKNIYTRRFYGQGTAHVAGDYTASAGWGTTRSVSAVAANDVCGRVTITCNGASIAANPTVTLTFKDGTWTTIPAIVISRGDGTAPTTGFWALTTASATAPVFTFFGTPVAGNTYTFDFQVMGK